MATTPLSGTNIALFSGIPFNEDYKHTRWFESLSEQQNYFARQNVVWTVNEANFQRIEGHAYVRINRSVDDLWSVNYLSFQNMTYNKTFYAFVTKIEYVQKNTCNVHFKIDVFQTWRFEMNFKPSYVVREHCPLWNADGTPIINTVPEGLNYGTEYDTVSIQNIQVNDGYKWLVIIAKAPMHSGANGTDIVPTVIGTPTPLAVYLVPFKNNDTTPTCEIPNQGLSGFSAQISKPTDVMKAIYKISTAVNNVVSIYVTDYTGIPASYSNDVFTFPDNGNVIQGVAVSDGTTSFNCLYVQKIEQFAEQNISAGGKWDSYKTVSESKLLMHPYTVTILDDFRGNRVQYKNEYNNDLELIITIKGSLGNSNKTSYGIQAYNQANSSGLGLQAADEFSLINNEPNDIPVITDNLAAFLQGNRNSLAVQKNSILFNGSMNAVNGALSTAMSGMYMGGMGVAQGLGNMVQGAGNTALQLQAIQAKQDDISNTPPSIAKMGSNTSYTFGNGYNGVFIIKKQIKDEYIKKLSDFFNMFGYKKNEVKIPNFNTRQSWNYVETKSCMITGSFNNEDLEELKSVFDSGITLWHTDDVGNYTLSNTVTT